VGAQHFLFGAFQKMSAAGTAGERIGIGFLFKLPFEFFRSVIS